MSEGFLLTPVDAIDLVQRALRKMESTGQTDEDVVMSVDSILSQTVFQLRNKFVVFSSEQVEAYELLARYAS